MSMTLEEAIKHAEYIASEYSEAVSVCWSAKNNKQLAEWLRELRERRKESKTIKCLDCIHALTCNRRIDFGNGLFFTISSCSMAERRTDDNSRSN